MAGEPRVLLADPVMTKNVSMSHFGAIYTCDN